ncbi:MAG TPA: carboxymuconolactone decarboxylase family protein, partial [Pseudoneobacillus sp.]|nr:carboxymuconolactone decarboxylase family protein [Pseudoneobacillus sp.]
MSENESLYRKSNIRRLKELAEYSPDTFHAFVKFNQLALATGAIPKKTKELIAVAVAHVTGCPYCIEGHVASAKRLEASKEEIMEAIMVATALKAGSAFAHGFNALSAYEGTGEEELYSRTNFNRFNEMKDINPEAFQAFVTFDRESLKAGLLSRKEKELIAVAVAHVTGC